MKFSRQENFMKFYISTHQQRSYNTMFYDAITLLFRPRAEKPLTVNRNVTM